MPTPFAPTIDRTALVKGPGHFIYGAALAKMLFCETAKGDLVTERLQVPVSGFGVIDERKKDETVKLSLTPAGQLNADLVGLLSPFGAMAIGASLYGASDVPMGIWSMSGQKLTLTAGAITKLPTIYFGADKFLVGGFEVTGILGKGLARTNAAALFTLAGATFTGAPSVADFVTLPASYAGFGTDGKGFGHLKLGYHKRRLQLGKYGRLHSFRESRHFK